MSEKQSFLWKPIAVGPIAFGDAVIRASAEDGSSMSDGTHLPQPIESPLRDGHHCDAPFDAKDLALGEHLARYMGTLYSDIDGGEREFGSFFYGVSTPVNEWSRIARALRVHGLDIVERNDKTSGL